MTVWQLSGWQQVMVSIIVGACLAFGVAIAVVSAWRAARRWARTASAQGRRALGWDLLGRELVAGSFIFIGAFFLVPYPALQYTLLGAVPVAVILSTFVRVHAEELRDREGQAGEQPTPSATTESPSTHMPTFSRL